MAHPQGHMWVDGSGRRPGGWALKAPDGMAGEAGKQPQVPTFRKLLSRAFGIFMSGVFLSSLGDRWREWEIKGPRGILDQYPLCSQHLLILWSPDGLKALTLSPLRADVREILLGWGGVHLLAPQAICPCILSQAFSGVVYWTGFY